MADPVINAMTGEVSIDLAGTEFRLRATMPRLADLQARLGVPGLNSIMQRVQMMDAQALYVAMRALCSSGNADRLDDMLLTPHLTTIVAAIEASLVAGLPEAKAGNA